MKGVPLIATSAQGVTLGRGRAAARPQVLMDALQRIRTEGEARGLCGG
jgi:hypothetical protein